MLKDPPYSQDPKSSQDDGFKPLSDDGKKIDEDSRKYSEFNDVGGKTSTNEVNAVSGKTSIELLFDPNMPALEDDSIFDFLRDDEDDGVVVDMNNLDTTIQVSPIPTIKILKDHPLDQVIGDLQSATQTRKMSKNLEEHGFVSTIQQRTNHKDLQKCLFACFLSQEEPKKVIHALKDPRWIEAMLEELLQFKNKKDEKGIVTRNKARLGAQGYTQEEGIDYNEVFAPIARIKANRLFLAYASFKDFVVYQMDVKIDFLYGKIKEEVYVCQPSRFEDPDFFDRVYKVKKALYGLHQSPKAWYETLSTYLLDNGFQRGKIDMTLFIKRHKGELTFFLGLQVQQKKDGIFISQDKYDEDGEEVDVHMYRSMIGSLMYLTSSRPDIMFAVCACARYQVNPNVSHLYAVKRIFKYLNGQPKLVFWYPKDSIFDLVAYTDSDYARVSLDRKSTTRGCQFLGCRLISLQCKKETVVIQRISLPGFQLKRRIFNTMFRITHVARFITEVSRDNTSLACHIPRVVLMLAQAGFTSYCEYLVDHSDVLAKISWIMMISDIDVLGTENVDGMLEWLMVPLSHNNIAADKTHTRLCEDIEVQSPAFGWNSRLD
ncbi:putative ribonuclease H-like domain-containing protein [Tanacetum coccineum]